MFRHLFLRVCLINLLMYLPGTLLAALTHEVVFSDKNTGRVALFVQNDSYNKEWTFDRFLFPDSSGRAAFNTESKGVSTVQIRTSRFRYQLWISPEEPIRASLLPPDTLSKTGFYELLPGKILFQQGGKYHLEIKTIDHWVDSFTAVNYRLVVLRRLKPALLAFDSVMQKRAEYLSFSENGKQYYRYQLAPMFAASAEKSKEIFEKYLSGKTSVENPYYLDFVKYFFKGYLYALMSRSRNENIEHDVNQKASLEELLNDVHKEAPQLSNDTLLQLVLLQEMRSWYSEKQNAPKSVLSIIGQIKQKALHPDIAGFASHIEAALVQQERGRMISTDGYTDAGGIAYRLVSGRAVPQVLIVYSSLSPEFQKELPLFEKVIAMQARQADFRFFCIDQNPQALPEGIGKDRMVHTGYDHQLFYVTGVRSVPFILMTGPDGSLIKYDLPMPSQGMNDWMNRFFKTGKI